MYAYLRFAAGINASLSGEFLSSLCCEPFVYLCAAICGQEIWHYAIFSWPECILWSLTIWLVDESCGLNLSCNNKQNAHVHMFMYTHTCTCMCACCLVTQRENAANWFTSWQKKKWFKVDLKMYTGLKQRWRPKKHTDFLSVPSKTIKAGEMRDIWTQLQLC